MEDIILFHGSRGGIEGPIRPESRIRSDFGSGFYMGTNKDQAKSLVATDPAPYFYSLKVNLSKIMESHILVLKDMEWAYFVLFNRGRLDNIKGSDLFKRCSELPIGKDYIIGPIADDAMNEAMSRFTHNEITDKAFLESIRAMKYGIQYVAKTNLACSVIDIQSEKELYGKELEDALEMSIRRRKEGSEVANKMQLKYRREGLYFDEILEKNFIEKRSIRK